MQPVKEQSTQEQSAKKGTGSRIAGFVKKEAVLCIALALAAVSAFFIPPDREYAGYIDYRTLAILFCLMCVMAGLQKLGLFRWIAMGLLGKVRSPRSLALILMLLCFFFSMLITNDVALITFVPFTFTVLELMGEERRRRLVLPVVVMQTVAANLGSMLTPVGNPQNLYLYGRSGMSIGAFVTLMLPYALFSLALLAVWALVQGGRSLSKAETASGSPAEVGVETTGGSSAEVGTMPVGRRTEPTDGSEGAQGAGFLRTRAEKLSLAAYLALFTLSLLAVAHVLPWQAALGIVLITVLLVDRKLLAKVDYSLLLTFVGFFVFIGNMGRIPAFRDFLQQVVSGREVYTAVVASQAISNVPAALLLSGFTDNYGSLIVGVNLGGLGTLIASMASLISYKYVAKQEPDRKGEYIRIFTLANLCFLAALLGFYMLWEWVGYLIQ